MLTMTKEMIENIAENARRNRDNGVAVTRVNTADLIGLCNWALARERQSTGEASRV